MEHHLQAMQLAIGEAEKALREGETPIGAVILHDGICIARAHNETERRNNPTSHAEMLAIERACQAMTSNTLTGCTLYVTLEPCPQCAAALIHAQISRVVFGAFDEKQGACGSAFQLCGGTLGWRIQIIGGIEKAHCEALLALHFGRIRERGRRF